MSLLNMSIAGAVMILVVILIRALLIDKLPKRTFIILWMIVIARLLIPIEIASKTSVYNLRPEIMTSPSTLSETKEVTTVVEETEVNYEVPIVEGRSLTDQIESVQIEEPVKTFKLNANHIWFIGAVLLSIYFARTYSKSKKILNTSIPCDDERIINYVKSNSDRNVDIRWLDRINTAITYGIFKPIIVLPKRLEYADDETIEKILLHEHYHIDSYDSIKKLLMMVTLIVHWFNPLVWIMYIIFNRDMELYCDERVLIHLGRDERADYAYTLIEQADRDNTFSLSSGFSKNALEERVRSVMKYKKSTVITIGLAVVILIGVVIFFATSKKDDKIKGFYASPLQILTEYNEDKSEFEFEIQNYDTVKDDKAERNPIYYIALNSDQDLRLTYTFQNSEESTVTLLNSLGQEVDIANSEEDSNFKIIQLTKGLNIFYVESKSKLGKIVLNGQIDDADSIVYISERDPEQRNRMVMESFDPSLYANADLKYDSDKNVLYYNGKRVKKFYDVFREKEKNLIPGVGTTINIIDYIDYEGEVYLYAARDYFNIDEKGIDEFIELRTVKGEAEYRGMIQNIQKESRSIGRDENALTFDSIMDKDGASDGEFEVLVKHGQIFDTPLYYLLTEENQEVGLDYVFKNSKGTTVTIENSEGTIAEIANSDIPEGNVVLKLTTGINTINIKSTGEVGEFSFKAKASKPDSLKNRGFRLSDIERIDSLRNYDESRYIDYSLTFDKKENRLFYKGKRVNRFFDLITKEVKEDGNVITTTVDYRDPTGEVYLHALRGKVSDVNGESIGDVIGLREVKDELAIEDIIRSEVWDVDLDYFRDEESKKYKEYEPYGLEYNMDNGKLYYQGKRVNQFFDLKLVVNENSDNVIEGFDEVWYRDHNGEVYVYADRDLRKLDVNGIGKLNELKRVKDLDAFYRKRDAINNSRLQVFELYYNKKPSDKLEGIVKDMKITIDGMKLVDKREKQNVVNPKNIIEVKYHYNKNEDVDYISIDGMQSYDGKTEFLNEYSFMDSVTSEEKDGVVYGTKYYVVDPVKGTLEMDFIMSNPYEHIGKTTVTAPIEIK